MSSQLDRLLTQLNGTGMQSSNNRLYQFLQQLLTFLRGIETSLNAQTTSNSGSLSSIISRTFLTSTSEVITLPNSRELLAGTNVTFDDSIAGQKTVNATGEVTATGTLTANQLIIGNGVEDIKALGTLGTTTTLLHGNAAGAPTFGAVNLATDVTGDLPFANLTQGAALSVLGVTGNAIADNASIVAASDKQVLRRSGTAVAFGAVDLTSSAAISGNLPVANLGNGTFTVVRSTATGAQNDWAPGLFGNTFILWSGASELDITGFAGGVEGQIIVFKNTNTSGSGIIATFAHNSGSSSAGNKLTNFISSGVTPVAPRGSIVFQYDLTAGFWRVISHEQGDWLTRTFSAGDFTGNGAMTWTVDAGDIENDSYHIAGKAIVYSIAVKTSTVGGTPNTELRVTLPNGYTCGNTELVIVHTADVSAAISNASLGGPVISTTYIRFFINFAGSNWTADVNGTYTRGVFTFDLT